MSKAQIATYFGLTHRETEEAISDLAAWRIDALLRRQTGLNRQIKWLFFRGWRDTRIFQPFRTVAVPYPLILATF